MNTIADSKQPARNGMVIVSYDSATNKVDATITGYGLKQLLKAVALIGVRRFKWTLTMRYKNTITGKSGKP